MTISTDWRRLASAQSPAVKELFGLTPEQKWPRQGMGIIEVDGWKLWVDPLGFRYQIRKHSHLKPHRAMAQCPKCAKIMSIGRVGQHMRVHLKEGAK